MNERYPRRLRLGIRMVSILCGSALFSSPGVARSACAPATGAADNVVTAMKTLFQAARTDDMALFNSVAEPEFYAYDNGKLFSGAALMNFIKQAHAAGKVYEWSVTEPKVHVACDLAWITYINKGSVQDSSGRQDLTWLESAVLDYRNGRWLIHFLHSTRAAAAQ